MNQSAGLLLAFDYGLKRIGVATANQLTRTASPLKTLSVGADIPWNEVDALVSEWSPDVFVVGDPGAEADSSLLDALGQFVAALESRYEIAIERVDERHTSAAAEDELRAGRRAGVYNRRLRKKHIDQHAACLIAERWMSEALDRH